MNANLPLFIGLRYIRSKRRNGFVSFISLLSFIAMTIGVMALIVVLSVMNGFDHEIKNRILNVVPHITLTSDRGVEEWRQLGAQTVNVSNVEAYAPFVEAYGLLSASGLSQGVLIQGVDPSYEEGVNTISQHMVVGDIKYLQSGEYGIVLGNLLARSLGVIMGDSVILSIPTLNVTPAGIFPRYKRFKVIGVFQVGAQVDNNLAFIHYKDGQKLLRLGEKVSGIKLRVSDPYSIDSMAKVLEKQAGKKYKVRTWAEDLASLFQAIKMEKKVVGTLLAAIIAVAAFNIIASLVLVVADKRRDIAVLRTLGATAKTVSGIFMIQGSVIGCLGVVAGGTLGCLLATFIGDIVGWLEQMIGFQVFDPNVYFISRLPSKLLWEDVALVCSFGLVLSLLATLYPASRAGQVLPAEALRYDR